jgi:hypothetical protein
MIEDPGDKPGHFVAVGNPKFEFFFVHQILRQLYPNMNQLFVGFGWFGDEHDRSVLAVKFEGKRHYTLQACDNEMAKKTSLGKTLPYICNSLLAFANEVEESVAQQKQLVGELFA